MNSNSFCVVMKSALARMAVLALSALGAMCAYGGTDVVQNLHVAQRFPWNGLVDITCDIGEEGASTWYAVSVSATVVATGETLPVRTIYQQGRTVADGMTVQAGPQHFVWDSMADAPGIPTSHVQLDVTAEETEPVYLYMVIDLSGGSSATSYPVTYLTEAPSGGFNTDEYKTSKLVLRRIEPGTFTMGERSTDWPSASDSDVHTVTLTKSFYIGVFEVTQRQWELVMGTKPSYFNNSSYYASRPVERVSYNDIRGSSSGAGWPGSSAVDSTSFLGKLRARTGVDTFDLPTEAQWEYACRAGTTTALNSGKNLTSSSQCANMAEVGRYGYNSGCYPNYSCSSSCATSAGTAKAGSYLPNVWGLYDMHGNVWEWCRDWYGGSLSGAQTDPLGASSGDHRVVRGGGWSYVAGVCRSGNRSSSDLPSNRHDYLGFRLSRTLP